MFSQFLYLVVFLDEQCKLCFQNADKRKVFFDVGFQLLGIENSFVGLNGQKPVFVFFKTFKVKIQFIFGGVLFVVIVDGFVQLGKIFYRNDFVKLLQLGLEIFQLLFVAVDGFINRENRRFKPFQKNGSENSVDADLSA